MNLTKKNIIIIIVSCLVLAIIIVSVSVLVSPKNKQNAVNNPASANLTKEELVVQNQNLQERVKQLEDTTKSFLGNVPEEKLYPVSGIAVSKNTISKDSSSISILPMKLDDKALNMDESFMKTVFSPQSQFNQQQKMVEVDIDKDTKIYLKPVALKEEIAPNPIPGIPEQSSQQISFDQFQGGAWPPYPVMIQTKTENPESQKKVKAAELTIFMVPPQNSPLGRGVGGM